MYDCPKDDFCLLMLWLELMEAQHGAPPQSGLAKEIRSCARTCAVAYPMQRYRAPTSSGRRAGAHRAGMKSARDERWKGWRTKPQPSARPVSPLPASDY